MERCNRRKILALSGISLTGTLAGCVSDDDTEGSNEPTDNTTNSASNPEEDSSDRTTTDSEDSDDSADDSVDETETTTQSQTLIEDTQSVQASGWVRWEFFLNQEANVTLRSTVRSGPEVDIIVTTQDEFEEYKNRNRFRYNSDISQMNTLGETTSTTLPDRDDFILLIDNSSAGEASPPSYGEDTAEVEVELVASA